MAPRVPWWQRPFRWLWAVAYNLVGVASQLLLGLILALLAILIVAIAAWALGGAFG